ncbi:hypothetical protein HG536_0H00160 [Torulaspora globosa]|uniref:Alpha-1,3-mannosyltransferase n=1 Tax=Torulaspora globosa TaxID=48254 RepID=A0A7G3ZMA6_9SACH|nr:uncharacterized protein HG536_0H00160 [Torulaspora globosa]QLL34642.1 hypothetical protein HG536_0H00160 [Torulaspora globosa]
MVFVHIPRRKKNILGGIFIVVCLYWVLLQRALFKDRLTNGVNHFCLQSLERLEERPVKWPTIPEPNGRIGDDVIETLLDLRDYEKCVMFNPALDYDRLKIVQKGLFPYLNLDLLYADEKKFWPVYSRWDGQSVQGFMPRFSEDENKFLGFSKIKYDQRLSFWGNWHRNIMQPASRGIVISAGAGQVEDCARLVKVLRHLGNRLPIEIVHRGDLSVDEQRQIFQISTEEASSHFPAQDLWFLDVSSMLNPVYAKRFKSFSNKWLAVVFSTFQNPVLLDADTIPFTSLDLYYNFHQFKTTGAVFFKDRKVNSDLLDKEQLDTLKRIFLNLTDITPIENESTESMKDKLKASFNDDIAAETVYNMIVKGQKHHMESGLVLIDKTQHLTNLLASIALQFSSVSGYFHGDKEWFWIAQALQKQSFTLHPKEASNVGKLGRVVSDEKGEFYQLCSVQLSHTDVDGSLLWVNGGLRTCKKDSWTSDYRDNRRISSMFDSEEAVREYYQSPVQLEAAIIPDAEIKPWIMTGECAMFTYCTLYREGEFGEVIKFNETQKNAYREIVRVWNSVIHSTEGPSSVI